MNRAAPPSPSLVAWLGAGFVVWSSALVTLYAVHAIGCAFAWPAVPLRFGLGVVLLMHIGALAAIWRHLAIRPIGVADGATRDFLLNLARWATISAGAATILTLGPALVLTTCV